MNILIVIGEFPKLSETFIFRKVVSLALHVDKITVAAREPGDWLQFKDYLPLPPNVHIRYLCPDNRLMNVNRIRRVFLGSIRAMILYPRSVKSLMHLLREQSVNRKEAVKLFLKYIGFAGLKPDVIHFEFLGLTSSYKHLQRFLGVPFIVSCRGTELNLFDIQSDTQQIEARNTLTAAARVHVVSDAMKKNVERVAGRTEGVWVNRPAVDTRSIMPNDNLISESSPLILATGRLVWLKGFDYLLTALAQIKNEGIPFSAKIIGDGPLNVPLKFSIHDLGLEDYVELTGAVSPRQVLNYMQRTSIFVLSSHEEGISNAVLEAMASGLPIVTTNAGGMAEAVRDGIDGFVIPIREIDMLADRLRRLCLDPTLRAKMGTSARQRAIEEFSIERQVQVFEKIYIEAINTKNNEDTIN